MEVVIVDDGSTDATCSVVEAWRSTAPFAVRFLRKRREGPGPARDFGVRNSRGEIIAFTDSDCAPARGWLTAAVTALAGAGLVTGPIELERPPDTHFFFNSQLDRQDHDRGLYRTANLVLPRDVYLAVGGFDRGFAYAGEDADLGWRVRAAGGVAVFAPDAGVTHLATPMRLGDWLRKPLEFAVLPRLVARHPQIRRTALFARYFLSRWQFLFDVAIAGVALAFLTRWWLLLLLAVPWFVACAEVWLEMARLGRLHKALAIQLLLIERYALGLAVLMWSSVRNRTVVL